jgi:hypothetical protein
MDAAVLANACGGHACDCHTAANSETVEGVVLIAERRHVRNKVGVLLEQADGLRLEGAGWCPVERAIERDRAARR